MALEKMLRSHQVDEATGLSRAQRYRLMARNLFPLPIQLGPNSRGWKESEIRAWVDARERGVDSPAGRRLRMLPRRSAHKPKVP